LPFFPADRSICPAGGLKPHTAEPTGTWNFRTAALAILSMTRMHIEYAGD
jgi:hypothetical protein